MGRKPAASNSLQVTSVESGSGVGARSVGVGVGGTSQCGASRGILVAEPLEGAHNSPDAGSEGASPEGPQVGPTVGVLPRSRRQGTLVIVGFVVVALVLVIR